jgi:hypothetical protein
MNISAELGGARERHSHEWLLANRQSGGWRSRVKATSVVGQPLLAVLWRRVLPGKDSQEWLSYKSLPRATEQNKIGASSRPAFAKASADTERAECRIA